MLYCMNKNMLKNISDIQNVLYINLESRSDRKEHVENQLAIIGLQNFKRFNAIKLENGALGCSMSHLKCLQTAKTNNWDHVLICEDDIQFLDPTLFISQFNAFLKTHNTWDVVLIAGNNMIPYKPIDTVCIQVYACQTTTGYIVQRHYYDTLIENYKAGIKQLMLEPQNSKLYAIDKYWCKLQRINNWFLIIPLTVVQRVDYSDIEKKETNFQKYMLDYNKCYK